MALPILLVQAISSLQQAIPVAGGIDGAPTIIIDPGHGGFDGGAESANGIAEKDINLSISLKLREVFTSFGCTVIMTRDTDTSTEDEGLNTIRKKKSSDIRNRIELIKEHPEAIVVSIHQNKFPQQQYWGAQVFYGVKHKEESKALAQIIQDNIRTHIQPENKREIKEGYKTIYFLQHAPNPTVMVECGFLSNAPELQNLIDPEYQSKLAAVIAVSVLDYIRAN